MCPAFHIIPCGSSRWSMNLSKTRSRLSQTSCPQSRSDWLGWGVSEGVLTFTVGRCSSTSLSPLPAGGTGLQTPIFVIFSWCFVRLITVFITLQVYPSTQHNYGQEKKINRYCCRQINSYSPKANKVVIRVLFWNTGRRGGGTPYNVLYGEASPERGTSFRVQVNERVGISLVEVYKRVGTSVI